MHIRNPIEWALSAPGHAVEEIGAADGETYWAEAKTLPVNIRRIGIEDLAVALRRGFEDFEADRTDIVVLALVFPIAGLFLSAVVANGHLLPLVVPLVAGFALIGPLASVWLMELSRLRESGRTPRVIEAAGILRSPQIGAILAMGGLQILLLLLWLGAAEFISIRTLGAAEPRSFAAFVAAALTTPAGWAMMAAGLCTGFVFAVAALAIGVTSFPLLLDRPADMPAALGISIRALRRNPAILGLWGLIVLVGLALGAVPGLLGIAIVLPILGHSTWHLYRRIID